MTDEFTKLAIEKQNEIASTKQLTLQEYLLFREWFFKQRKNVGRRMAARNFDLFFAIHGMDIKIIKDDNQI